LGRAALHNALRRLIGVGEGIVLGIVQLIPQKVRIAFLAFLAVRDPPGRGTRM
jgi:hypothetical protein